MLELHAALAGASEGASFRAPTCRVRDGWVFTTVSTNALLGLTFPLLLEASLTVTAGCVLSLLALYSVSALLPIRLRWPVGVPEPVPPLTRPQPCREARRLAAVSLHPSICPATDVPREMPLSFSGSSSLRH